MIQATVSLETDTQKVRIAQVRIYNTSGLIDGETTIAQYVAEFVIDEGDDVSFISRTFTFNRKHYNALALVQQALDTLTEEELRFHGKASGSGHVAWGQSGTVPEAERQLGELRNHRSSLRDGFAKWASTYGRR